VTIAVPLGVPPANAKSGKAVSFASDAEKLLRPVRSLKKMSPAGVTNRISRNDESSPPLKLFWWIGGKRDVLFSSFVG
jgi:hypothetical protein